MMNQEIKQRWIQALRSGEYNQGYENLYHCGKFCCLGVLTDLYIKEHDLQWERNSADLWSFEGHGSVLPDSVARWSGLLFSNPFILGTCATDYNDKYQNNFATIADFIEEDEEL